jgi:hypothetical protein
MVSPKIVSWIKSLDGGFKKSDPAENFRADRCQLPLSIAT